MLEGLRFTITSPVAREVDYIVLHREILPFSMCVWTQEMTCKYAFTHALYNYNYIYTVTVQILRHAVKEELNKFLAAEPVS